MSSPTRANLPASPRTTTPSSSSAVHSAPSSNRCQAPARDHGGAGVHLALTNTSFALPSMPQCRPLAWCSRPRSLAASLHGALVARSLTAEGTACSGGAGAHALAERAVFFAGVGALATEIAAARLLAPYYGKPRRSSGERDRPRPRLALRRRLGRRKGGGPQPEPACPRANRGRRRSADRDRPVCGGPFSRHLGEGAGPGLRRSGDRLLLRRARALRPAGDPAGHGRAVRGEARYRGRPGRRLRRWRRTRSTVGSLLGTFLSALVLIPAIGTRRTLLVAAVTVALSGAVLLGRRGSSSQRRWGP